MPRSFRLEVPLMAALLTLGSCSGPGPTPVETRVTPTPKILEQHCKESIGEPRVVTVTKNLFVAVGFDLANTIVLRTPEGNIVIDAMMSPERAQAAKTELMKVAPGKTLALIYTHSHIDHVGGASVWLDEGTEIWATDRFKEHFLKQYGTFQKAEQRRGVRQFARHIPKESLQCSGLGRRPDFEATVGGGMRFPTKTFSGKKSLEFGGVALELVEAHGETDDQLFVWIPSEQALMPGDNYYRAFPNLYTIRGSRPRPVGKWIESLDRMRELEPGFLVPSHTIPVVGKKEIRRSLTDYRDAIAWVRDTVVQGANAGRSLDDIAEGTALPAHLAKQPQLLELYGQLDWSARAIYTNEMGWFDGHPEQLYTLPRADIARRELELMGGRTKVLAQAESALAAKDGRWAVHLYNKLLISAESDGERKKLRMALSEAHRVVASGVFNTNGRGYLLQSAFEYGRDSTPPLRPKLNEKLIAEIPIDNFFNIMQTRLKRPEAMTTHETLEVSFTDTRTSFFVTVRRGVVEVSRNKPLPGTPTPIAVLKTDTLTYKKIALGLDSPVAALADDRLEIDGSMLNVRTFTDRFTKGL